MDNLYQQIIEATSYIKRYTSIAPQVAVVLGTGLGRFTDRVEILNEIPYSDIPHFPTSTVEGHAGKLILGKIGQLPIVVMAGRFHYYEGYSAKRLTFPIRVLKALGAERIILTNASGAVNPYYKEGEIVCVTDHINMFPDHPLRGDNDERLGLRFPDMLHVYDSTMLEDFSKIAEELKIPLKKGVYLGWQGPSLETPAEYKLARIFGADVLGMSTVPEVIVAHHAGLKIGVFSIVSNICFPKSNLTVTTLEDVIRVVDIAASKLELLLVKYLQSISNKSGS
jgi:purine-nucleoside phosphorylase